MLVVLASSEDPAGATLLDAWPGEARRLSAGDLSCRGWAFEPGGGPGRAVLAGERIAAEQIDAVVTQLPCVAAGELEAIAPPDREYVAAEMTAFLAAWLSELTCPVLNRPLPGQLMGPSWSAERWAQAARALGIATRLEPVSLEPVSESADGQSGPADGSGSEGSGSNGEGFGRADRWHSVTVVGGRAVGAAETECRSAAEMLAIAAGVALLRAHFVVDDGTSAFRDADYWVDVADPEVIAAIVDHVEELGR